MKWSKTFVRKPVVGQWAKPHSCYFLLSHKAKKLLKKNEKRSPLVISSTLFPINHSIYVYITLVEAFVTRVMFLDFSSQLWHTDEARESKTLLYLVLATFLWKFSANASNMKIYCFSPTVFIVENLNRGNLSCALSYKRNLYLFLS